MRGGEGRHERLQPRAGRRRDGFRVLALRHRARHDARFGAAAGREGARGQVGRARGREGARRVQVVAAEQAREPDLAHLHVAGPGGRRAAGAERFPFGEVAEGPGCGEEEGGGGGGGEGVFGYCVGEAFEELLRGLGERGGAGGHCGDQKGARWCSL